VFSFVKKQGRKQLPELQLQYRRTVCCPTGGPLASQIHFVKPGSHFESVTKVANGWLCAASGGSCHEEVRQLATPVKPADRNVWAIAKREMGSSSMTSTSIACTCLFFYLAND